MNISRSLFLAMTGALASGACYIEPGPPPPPPPAPVAYAYPAPPPTYAPAPPPPAETSFVTPARPAPPYGYPYIVRRRARRVGVAVAEPGYRPPPPNFALGPSSEGVAPPSDGLHPVAPAPAPPVATPVPVPPAPSVEGCLDTEPMSVPDCNQVRVEPSCGIRSFVMQRCNTYRTYMDAKVATAAVGCMTNLTPRQLCDAENTYSCGKVALSEACEDTDLKQMCKIAAGSCKTTANDCIALLSGLSDTGKQKIAECISHGCHAGLYSCVEGLK